MDLRLLRLFYRTQIRNPLRRNLIIRPRRTWRTLRKRLTEHSGLFVMLYALWIRACSAWHSRHVARKHWKAYEDWHGMLRKRFPRRADLVQKVLRRVDNHYYRISFFPGGLKRLGADFPWSVTINKKWGLPLWHDIDIDVGKLFQLAVRWDDGRRCYFALRVWMINYKRLFQSSVPYGRWEFYHEVFEVTPQLRVSQWWWGRGWFRVACHRGSIHNLYHHFGKLLRWTWRGKRHGLIGVTLTEEQKQRVYWDYYAHEAGQWGKRHARIYLDVVTGFSRSMYREYFWCCCIRCGMLLHPGEWPEEKLWCDECRREREREEEEEVEIATAE